MQLMVFHSIRDINCWPLYYFLQNDSHLIELSPANSVALPPAAVVLTVTVCSAQKRYR